MSRRLLPREKALRFGISSLTDDELLALILSVGSSKANVFTLSRHLVEEFSMEELSRMPLKALMQIQGIGEAKAVRLAAAFEIGRRIYLPPEGRLEHDHVRGILSEIAGRRKETLVVAMYDAANRFLGREIVAVGSMNVMYVQMREVFEPLFRVGATHFILAHNHPDGSTEPSEEDREFTRRVDALSEELGFSLVESFVVGRDRAVGILNGTLIRLRPPS